MGIMYTMKFRGVGQLSSSRGVFNIAISLCLGLVVAEFRIFPSEQVLALHKRGGRQSQADGQQESRMDVSFRKGTTQHPKSFGDQLAQATSAINFARDQSHNLFSLTMSDHTAQWALS